MKASKAEPLYTAAAAIDAVAQAHRAMAAATLHDLGVSESTAGLLWLLSDNAGCTMSQAAERLSCDRSNVTLLATQLEKRGFLERTADPDDGRRRNLHLTADGERAATTLRDALVTGSPLRHLTAEECAELGALLQASLTTGTSPAATADRSHGDRGAHPA